MNGTVRELYLLEERFADFFAHADDGFYACEGIFKDVWIDLNGIRLKQQHHRGAAELEISLFLTAPNACLLMMIDDLSYQQRADLHREDAAKGSG